MFYGRKLFGAPPRLSRLAVGSLPIAVSALLFAPAAAVADEATSTAPPVVQRAAVAANQGPTTSVAMAYRASDGAELVFYRGQDGAVYQRTHTSAGWGAESRLSGTLVGAPAAAFAGSTLAMVARSTDGKLWLRTLAGGVWSLWQDLGGVVSAAPAITGSSDGRLDVFVRGADDRLYTRTRLPGASWSPWTSLGGTLSTGPGAVAFGSGNIDVYVSGSDHKIWRINRTASGWSAWALLGGTTYTAPAAARIPGTNLAQVFARGTNNYLYVNRNLGSSFSGWTSLGGTLIDAPAATGTPTGADVVVRGVDNALYWRSMSNGVWAPYVRGWTPAPLPAPASSLLGTDWTRIPTTAKVVALTFDAGANAAGLASIRATLERQNVPATFFLTGSWVRSFPAQANEVAVGGFRVGNHSDTHPNFTGLTDAQVQSQVTAAQRAILLSNGVDSHPLFRFPYGAVNSRVLADVNRLGYVAVRWTVDSLGWQGTSGGQTTQRVIDRVLAAARPGEIVLMHVGSNPDDHTTLDAAALPSIISGLRARGYSFVTLQALTG